MKKNNKLKVEEPKKVAKKSNVGIFDWINVGIAFTALIVTSIWSFVLTARSIDANITVQAMLLGGGVLVNYFSINAILKVIKR